MRRKRRSVAASHPTPQAESGAAQDAARPPKDDEEAQGKAANAEEMNEAKPKEFDKDAFIKAVEKAIAEKAPKNLDEADKFADSGKADEVRAEVQGEVGEGKRDSAEQIATTTAAPPDTSAAVPKKVVPMAADRPSGAPATPDPANAVPDKLPPSATDMSAGPARVDGQMAEANVTETQLKRSNEPTFSKALSEKKVAERHSATAPGKLRKHEATELRASTAQAKRLGTAAMASMGALRVRAGQRVDTGKTSAKGRDEEKRAQVTALLQGVFDTMKKDVEAILGGLDKLVGAQFGRGEKAARDAFTAEHKRKMEEYKDRRYSGAMGKLRWVRDLFAGLPAEADKIFDEARDNYVRRMRQVISDVADTIGAELNRAKRRIAQGRTELQAAVRKLPAELRSIGQQAAAEFTDKFDELTQSVDDKGTQLVDTLATKYTDALKSVDDEIAAEKEKNKGLVAKAVDAVKAVINTILELKRLLLSVLAKAAQAVMLILKDPIGFLRNLVSAVGAGLRQFLQNIGRHLQQGILSWLLGKTAEAGIELPAKFDIQGVLKMLASLLGLTWQNIRARIVRKVPKMEPAIAAAETAVPLVAEVRKRGVAGMWEDLKTRVGDLRKNLLDKVIEYVTPTIVQAGIMWVISLLNPASAFVRAVKLIIDIVRFIVTQARQIFEFVGAVLDAVISIARGGSGGVPGLIERALARSIPVLLGVLAAILGVGGIAARVKQIVQAMTKPVNRAVDWVIDKIVGLVKKVWTKIKSSKAWSKAKDKTGKAWSKVKERSGKAWSKVKEKAAAVFSWIAQKITGKTIAKPFAMASGERHTLTAHPSGSGLKITIASAFAGEIRSVMTKVEAEANKLPDPEKAKALTAISGIKSQLVRVSAAEKRWLSGKAAAEKAVKKRVEKRKAKGKIKTAAEAEALSRQWLAEKEQKLYQPIEKLLADQIRELSKLTSMKQFVQVRASDTRRLPRGYDVRTRLYVLGSGWKSQSSAWRAKEKKTLVEIVRTALALGQTPKARAQLVKLDQRYKLPENALDLFDKGQFKAALVEQTAYDVDHHPMPLAQHWTNIGYNTGDIDRRNATVDTGNWRLITHKKNVSLQAGGYHYHKQRDLGKSFTSELADGGIPNAKRIDGRPLLDEKERPIP
ncbi:HPC2 multi-domain protein [Streptomyces sp. NPDC005322]|uniref:phage tail protein n=1 Tax=Streptomyces sp. NPDC005322 TaxID=3157032 RepID=UPI0033A7D868